MALDKVPSKPPVSAKGALQIDDASGTKRAQVRSLERFLEEIEGKAVFADGGDREATAVH